MDENRTETAFRGASDVSLADSSEPAGVERVPHLSGYPGAADPPVQPDAETSNNLPNMILAVAGLTVFDSIIIVVFLALWAVNPQAMLGIIKPMARIALLLSVAPIVLGGLILHTNKQSGTIMPGTPWAGVGMLIGVILATLTLLIPLLSAVRLLLGGPLDTAS